MQLLFLYGQVASGKLTVGRELAALTGLPLFHNHLMVDALAAVFPFGSAPFVALREDFWLRVIGEAACIGQSLIFTFAPESTVSPRFPAQVEALVERRGGRVVYVALTVPPEEQANRIANPSRAAFGKVQSVDLLDRLHDDFNRSMAQMPAATLSIDTQKTAAAEAAQRIAALISA